MSLILVKEIINISCSVVSIFWFTSEFSTFSILNKALHTAHKALEGLVP